MGTGWEHFVLKKSRYFIVSLWTTSISLHINLNQLLEKANEFELRFSLQWLIVLHSFALFSGICPQLLNTHKPSSVAAADVNRHLATAFWCKSSSADTVFKRGRLRERQKEIQRKAEQIKTRKDKDSIRAEWAFRKHCLICGLD